MSAHAKPRDPLAEARSLLKLTCGAFGAIEQEEYLERWEFGDSSERSVVAAHYAESLRENLEGVLESLEARKLEWALLGLAAIVSNLPPILRSAVKGTLAEGDRQRGGATQRRASATRLRSVETRIAELRKESPPAFRSAAACLRRIYDDGPSGEVPADFEDFKRWYYRARRAAKGKKGHP